MKQQEKEQQKEKTYGSARAQVLPEHMLTRREALDAFFEDWQPHPETEYVDLADAAGRIASEDLFSKVTLPVYRTAGMDGIAVRSADFADGKMPDVSAWVPGRDYVRADTGDDFPDRFDAVIMVEQVIFSPDGRPEALNLANGFRGASSGGTQAANAPLVRPGMNTRPAGGTIRAGSPLILKNEKIRPSDLAACAMGNYERIPVWKKPVVAFLPTGSELIPPGRTPKRGENIDANTQMVSAMIREMGGSVISRPITRDDPAALRDVLLDALAHADIVLMNGGSSKGEEDYTLTLMRELGTVLVHNVAAVPGRPVTLGLIGGKAVVNLPGPTLAAYFVCDWCVRELIAHWLHQKPAVPELLTGILRKALPKGGPVEIIHRLNVRREADGTYGIWPLVRGEASAAAMMNADAQYVTGLFEEAHPAGTPLTVSLLRNLAEIPDGTEHR